MHYNSYIENKKIYRDNWCLRMKTSGINITVLFVNNVHDYF